MYLSNFHSHSVFCDGRASMEDFVRFAIAKGVKKYGFSSHAPLPFPAQWTMNEDDFEDYRNEFIRLKNKYADRIELYLGLEADYIHGCSNVENAFFRDKPLDYLICSIHYLDRLEENNYWSIDGDFADFNTGLMRVFKGNIRPAVRRFLEITNGMIECGGFDIVGHFDKITMHGLRYTGFKATDPWFIDLATESLRRIKKKGMILEINTKSFASQGITFPHANLYPIIKRMGIPIMVNSDCHYPTNIIDSFEPVYKALYRAGFRTVCQLSANGWINVPFDINGLK